MKDPKELDDPQLFDDPSYSITVVDVRESLTLTSRMFFLLVGTIY